MNVKIIPYCFSLAVLFFLFHIGVTGFHLNDTTTFLVILSAMVFNQLFTYYLLNSADLTLPGFKTIFAQLALTQFFSIALITIYAIVYPNTAAKPVQLTDVFFSFGAFVITLPLILSAVIWFIKKGSAHKA